MKKKVSWALLGVGVAVLIVGLVLRFAMGKDALLDPAALCLIGLALSMEYHGSKFKAVTYIFQALSVLVFLATAASWFAAFPQSAVLVLRIAALAVNIPLAAVGLLKDKK